MNYDEDDELERMRQRRQMRREAQRREEEWGKRETPGSRSGSQASGGARRTSGSYAREAGRTASGRSTGNRSAASGRSAGSRNTAAGSDGRRSSASRSGSGRASARQDSGERRSASFRSGYSGPKGAGGSGRRGGGKRKNRMDRKKKILISIGCTLLFLAVLVGGAYAYINHRIFGSMQKIEFDEGNVANVELDEEQLAQMKGYWNIACFGVDSRADKDGNMNVGKGTNADVNLICSINLETGEIKLVSVFRDTYLNISDKNSYNKINAAYAIGGPEQAVKALNKNLGLNITQYATFNWKAVADAINILGGIDIELSESERSWINAYITETVNETGIGSHQIQEAGLVHMDGVQAVAYGRLRYGDTDYARTERQRIVLQKAFEKAKGADWATLNNILVTVLPQVATNVEMGDLVPLARRITSFHIGDTKGFPMARGEMDIGKVGDCVIPQTLESNVIELHQYLFGSENYEVPSNVKSYSSHISEVSGMYTAGKSIDHVPVDQGLNASTYIKAKQRRAAEKAAAEQQAKAAEEEARRESQKADQELETEAETETKDYLGDNFEDFDEEDWEEFWGGQNWYDDWGDDGIGGDEGATGPGAGPGGPSGNTGSGGSTVRPGSGGSASTTAADPGNSQGPGSSGQTGPSGGNTGSGSQGTSGGNTGSGGQGTSGGNTGSGSQGTGSVTRPPSETSGAPAASQAPSVSPVQEEPAQGPGGPSGPGA